MVITDIRQFASTDPLSLMHVFYPSNPGKPNYYTLHDEGMASPEGTKDADWLQAVNSFAHMRARVDPTGIGGLGIDTVTDVSIRFHHEGRIFDHEPVAYFRLYVSPVPFAEGTPIAEKMVNLWTNGVHKDVQVTFGGLSLSPGDYEDLEWEIAYIANPPAADEPEPFE